LNAIKALIITSFLRHCNQNAFINKGSLFVMLNPCLFSPNCLLLPPAICMGLKWQVQAHIRRIIFYMH